MALFIMWLTACRFSFRVYGRFGFCLVCENVLNCQGLTVVDILQVARLVHVDIDAPRVYQHNQK